MADTKYGNQFQIEGVVSNKRELTSSKPGSKWKGYILEIAELGQKHDIDVEAAVFARVALGEAVKVQGTIQHNGPRVNLKGAIVRNQSEVAGAPAKG